MFSVLQFAILWIARQLWYSLPLFATLAAMAVTMAPANLFRGWAPAPDLVLASVFFWAIFGPAFLPAFAVFLLGLAKDFATGGPIGFWAVTYLVAYGFTLSQRVFFIGRSGPGVWFGFATVASVTAIFAWLLGSIALARWVHPGPIVLQVAVTVLFYPLVSRVFTILRSLLSKAREAI